MIVLIIYVAYLGSVPVDGSFDTLTLPIILPLTITYYVMATIGIVLALVCLFFNIIFRERK